MQLLSATQAQVLGLSTFAGFYPFRWGREAPKHTSQKKPLKSRSSPVCICTTNRLHLEGLFEPSFSVVAIN